MSLCLHARPLGVLWPWCFSIIEQGKTKGGAADGCPPPADGEEESSPSLLLDYPYGPKAPRVKR